MHSLACWEQMKTIIQDEINLYAKQQISKKETEGPWGGGVEQYLPSVNWSHCKTLKAFHVIVTHVCVVKAICS
jgi:hypothetical protein